jgi:ribonuclease D
VHYDYLDDVSGLRDFCRDIARADSIAFDTEFISEDSYQPDLCLIQVAAGGRLAVIDPLAVEDLKPFWDLLVQPTHTTIVHSGREEFRFCIRAGATRPSGWFDVQLAAAFVGLEYPAAYGTLIHKLIGKSVAKGETRTDWRRRPLSRTQLEYALEDVRHLEPMRDVLLNRLRDLGRETWFREDTQKWQNEVEDQDLNQTWRRVAGIANLAPRSLAIVRELWAWRDQEAKLRNCPARRLLRDDLIIELARRKTADEKRIAAVRGLERNRRQLTEIATRIQKALELADDQCPRLEPKQNSNSPQFGLLGQYLNASLGVISRSAQLAPTLVGTVQDVRDLIAYRLEIDARTNRQPPLLAQGWRAELVGRVIDDLLEGRLVMRVHDPFADQPLIFEPAPTGPVQAS